MLTLERRKSIAHTKMPSPPQFHENTAVIRPNVEQPLGTRGMRFGPGALDQQQLVAIVEIAERNANQQNLLYLERTRGAIAHDLPPLSRQLSQNLTATLSQGVLISTRATPSGERQLERLAMQWVEENSDYLEGLRGEWILVVGRDLVAHSHLHSDILRLYKERRFRGALIHYVPRADETYFQL